MAAVSIPVNLFLGSVAAVVALEALGALAVGAKLVSPWLAMGVMRLGDILIVAVLTLRICGSLTPIGLGREMFIPGVRRGILWALGVAAAMAVAMGLAYVNGFSALQLIRTELPQGGLRLALFYALAGVVAPVAEEMVFRGILYGLLRRWGRALALAVSTLAFVAAHYQGNGFPLTQAAGGLLFAWAYEVEGKLMVPVMLHTLGNMAIFTLSLL